MQDYLSAMKDVSLEAQQATRGTREESAHLHNGVKQECVKYAYPVQEELRKHLSGISLKTYIIVGASIWAVTGIFGFIMSLICFGRSGNRAQHVLGVILALLLGPFYWIYFMMPDYCRRF